MALNPLLILQGQQPDIAGGVFRADQAGFNQGQRNRENALQTFQRDQGAALFQGDPDALNQFAQFDPQGAFAMRGQQEARQQAIAARQAAAARAAASQQAASAQAVSDADRAEIERTLAFSTAVARDDPENWATRMANRGYGDFVANTGIGTAEDFNRVASGLYAHYGVDAPAAPEYVTVGDSRVRADQPYSAPDAGYRQLTAQEASGLNLPPENSYQMGPDGKVSQIGGGGVSVSVDARGPDSGKFNEAAAKVIVDEMAATAEAGAAAQRSSIQIDRLDNALSTTAGGAITGIQAWLGSKGIATGGLDNVQLAEAIISQLVPQQRPPGSGVMSDADLALYKLSLPRLINTPGGNAEIIRTLRGIANYDVQMGRIARQALLSEITPREAFDAYQAVENPLAAYSSQSNDIVDAAIAPSGVGTSPMPQGFTQNQEAAEVAARRGVTVNFLWDSMNEEQRALWLR